jgi:hypothetical protein
MVGLKTLQTHMFGWIKKVNGMNNIQEKTEEYIMKHLQFNKNGVNHSPIKHWKVDNVTEVAIYQGERGERPDLDFIVKYKEEGKRLRTPSHTHWIVDLLVKSEVSKENLLSFVNDMIKIYDETVPFQSVEERNNYLLKFPTQMVTKHSTLQGHGYYSIQTLTTFIELFSKCEKQSTGAFMFRGLLSLVKEYCEGRKDFYQIVGYSKRV